MGRNHSRISTGVSVGPAAKAVCGEKRTEVGIITGVINRLCAGLRQGSFGLFQFSHDQWAWVPALLHRGPWGGNFIDGLRNINGVGL